MGTNTPAIWFSLVHSDDRRTIFANDTLLKDEKEVSIINLPKGKAIGACKHKNVEYLVILEGGIGYMTSKGLEELNKGDSRRIPANEPHTFIAREDTILMEWGITAEEKKNQDKDESHLRLIKSINESNGKPN